MTRFWHERKARNECGLRKTLKTLVAVEGIDQERRRLMGFKLQLLLVATSSQSIDVFQRQLTAGPDSDQKAAIFRYPKRRSVEMFLTKQPLALVRTLGVALVAILGLASCATYDDEFATINTRLDQLDTKVQGAAQSAESANQSAQQANQRLDQIEGRVQQLEAAPPRKPRG